jgi:ribosomal subunit interface protein
MKLSVKGHHLDVSEPLRAYAERRVGLGFGEFADRVTGIEVRISDVNGPRGGIDKNCAITLIVRRVGVVFAQARGGDAYSTIDSAASRVRSVLVSRLGRHRHRRRRPSSTWRKSAVLRDWESEGHTSAPYARPMTT